MRIVLASLWFPVGVGAYLLRAARRIQREQLAAGKSGADFLEVVTVGPTTGAECWGFKEFQFPEYAVHPNFLDPALTVQSFGSGRNHFEPPDLWIDIDGGRFTDAAMPWPHAVVATDPHMDIAEHGPHWKYERQRDVADFFFCMQRPYCLPKSLPATYGVGKKPDFFLPYAYDPEVFHPYPDQAMDCDVTVLGIPYTKRTAVAKELQRRGFRVLSGMGSVYERYARDLCRAPVCFIWSLKDDVPCRVFEAAACGRTIVVNMDIALEIQKILPRLGFAPFNIGPTDDKTVVNAADAVEGLFQKNGRSWSTRSSAANIATGLSTVAGHTWDARLRQIVKTCLGREI